ncbi:hypothetical protein B9Z19DRAFT_1130205 [Tuber borchii]|uniref:Uncharacterized protein n=1 Tax=Tuber borchii TaxID=42251 RepID=A0A2T6ZKW9_TUBBO|nr:hypothetical protein B9Z19DRAFT_1130205 [Tuber borchii]
MASLLPFGGRPFFTPLSIFYPRRTPSPDNQYASSTSPPLPPHPTSLPPLETSEGITNSHYYRPLSPSTDSPTRTPSQLRVQSPLDTDTLLCHPIPITIIPLSTSRNYYFEPGKKEWSLHVAKGTIKINEWLHEVEDRAGKRRKTGMGSIRDEEEGAMLDCPGPGRRRLSSEDNGTGGSGGTIFKHDTPEVRAVEAPKPQRDSPGLRRDGKLLTLYQLKMQRQGVAEVENGGRSEPDQILVNPVEKIGAREGREEQEEEEEEQEEDQDGELEEGSEYWGSLKRSVLEGYETRIEVIKSEIKELGVDGLKDRVLSYRASAANLLTDSSAIMAITTLQLLLPLSRLTKLLSVWAVRIAVLRIVPIFLGSLQIAKNALEVGYTAITHPSTNPEPSSLDWDRRGLDEESYTLIQETITQKVAAVGMLMDIMLKALEGREDVLPERWIAKLEDLDEGVGRWEMYGERVVMEGRLRFEETIIRQSGKEEEAHEREKALLVLERGGSVQEARVEEEATMEVMEKAEETDKRLREALETDDIVTEAMNLPDEDESDRMEPDSNPKDLEELFSKLEDVEKERSLADDVKIKQKITAEMEKSLQKERSQEGASDQSGAQQAALHAESEKRIDEKREVEVEVEVERCQPVSERAESEEITKSAEAQEKTLEAEERKVTEEELAKKARLEFEAKRAGEAKCHLLAEEAAQKENATELERLAEAECQCLDTQRREEESAAAKPVEQRRAIEAERAAVVEVASQVFVRGQAGFDDKRFQELDRRRRLAEVKRVGLTNVALARREKAREAKQQCERESEEERAKGENSIFSSPTGLGETVGERILPTELSQKAAKKEISRDPRRATLASKNRTVAPRSGTPTLVKALAKDLKQRFTLGSSSSATSTTAGYKRPTSRREARPPAPSIRPIRRLCGESAIFNRSGSHSGCNFGFSRRRTTFIGRDKNE